MSMHNFIDFINTHAEDPPVLVLKTTAMMMIIVIVGVFCKKTKLISDDGNRQMSKLVLSVINPAVLLMSYQREYNATMARNLLSAFGLAFVAFVITIATAYIAIPAKEGRDESVERLSVIYANCGFMGIPLVNSLFGSEGVFYLAAYLTIFHILMRSHGIFLISGDKKSLSAKHILTSPVIISIAIGVTLYFTRITLPSIMSDAFNSVKSMNTPLAMIVAGIMVADTNVLRLLKKPRMYYLSFLKLILIPGIVTVAVSFLHVTDIVSLAVIIATSAPTAGTCTLQCIRYRRNGLYSSEIFAFATVFSMITMPLMVKFYFLLK